MGNLSAIALVIGAFPMETSKDLRAGSAILTLREEDRPGLLGPLYTQAVHPTARHPTVSGSIARLVSTP